MKLKFISSVLMLTCSFAMEKTDAVSGSYGQFYFTDHLPAALSSSLALNASSSQDDLSFVFSPQRYFKLDKASPIPLIEQHKEQAKEIYQACKLYLKDQKTFLEQLRQQASAQNYTNLQSLHPWFSEIDDAGIIDRLNFNIKSYECSIITMGDFLRDLDDPKYTLDNFFERMMVSRTTSLMIREERRMEDNCPPSVTKFLKLSNLFGYGRFLSLHSITNFRLFDEHLYALFPHISQNCFMEVDAINQEDLPIREGWLIKQDYALMQFLAGQIRVPYDPDTTWELRTREVRPKSVYNYLTRKYEELMIPVIPREYTKLFNVLYASLAKEPAEKDDSFLPAEVKRLQYNKKKVTKGLKGKQNAKNKAQASSSTRIIHAKVTPSTGQAEQVEVHSLPNSISAFPSLPNPHSPTKVKFKPAKPIKPTIPQGGWSHKDQQRNAETKLKAQAAVEARANEGTQIEFQPDQPITLSAGQYQTLQEILDENAPAYKMTFNRIKDLLEAVGIKVERNGGSHARIQTPGHNIKALVDIHYGWTDKYGPGTMKTLRTLMRNLSLDNPNFVNSN
ncbi:hypothetical protein [Candidatus Odyssella acanthamoebae]|uniref:Uncharacterized protein n=1 Tax=Candidatus Odyssella acanthamoebae TaxID=91604 RepID=A0A077ASD1_9PROT|nr:hypothetical protein [Candidatus Paracaedibacter acanthamoebae]AIK96102.1 hypothetical protein ID47_04125 [Candidatus Paracaedibacter acanthamoebae]